MPTMTGWLADDTYMAGFDISKLETTEGLYLTFTETDKSQRFTQQVQDIPADHCQQQISTHICILRR